MRSTPIFKILSIAVLAAVVALLGVDAYRYFHQPVSVSVAYSGQVTDSISVNGWVIRQETPLPETSGTLLRQVQEGEKVHAGQTVAMAYADKEALELVKQLEDAGISWKEISTIFVTHKHIDHLLGIIWMLRMYCQGMARGQFGGEVTIYGHDEVISLLKQMAEMLLTPKETKFIGDKVHLEEVKDGEDRTILGHRVTFFDILSTKAKQFGFCMEYAEGKKLTCCGDEPYNECEQKYAKNSTWLLHEAFCLFSQADKFKPYEKHHSTVKDACELAQKLEAENLILYHTEDKNISRRKELYTEEGRQYYKGNLWIPDDLETYKL